MEQNKKVPLIIVRLLTIGFAIVVVTMLILAASNYTVQWRQKVNDERMRYLEVFEQALEYYYLDHGVPPELPDSVHMISNTDTCNEFCPAKGKNIPCFDLEPVLVPGYVRELPQDPLLESDVSSGFYIMSDEEGFTVGACDTFFNQDLHIKKIFQ